MLLLAGACVGPEAGEANTFAPREAKLKVARVSREPAARANLAFGVEGQTLGRLGEDFRDGRTWLHFAKPRGFSFVGAALLESGEVFRPNAALITYAQDREGHPGAPERALLRLEGTLPIVKISPRIESIEPPPHPVKGLGEVEEDDIRVLLGRGIDNLMRMVPAKRGGYGEYDTHGWIGVVGLDGALVDWQASLVAAHRSGSLDPLREHRVLVRRWRPGDSPRARFYRLHFTDVVAAAQMKLVRQTGSYRWTWEGVWNGRMRPPPSKLQEPVWEESPPPMAMLYREYERPEEGSPRSLWRVLMAPVVLGADVGRAFFEGDESTLDRIGDRIRD